MKVFIKEFLERETRQKMKFHREIPVKQSVKTSPKGLLFVSVETRTGRVLL